MKGNRIAGCGIVAAALIVVLVVVAVLAITRPARMVRAEIARIKAEGAPLTMKDLDGPKIPDSQNGAVVYQKAFALISGKDAKKDMDLIADRSSLSHQPKTEAEWRELRRALAKYDRLVPIVEQAASKPDCRFPIGWEKSGALDASFPHLHLLRDISRILSANALLSTREDRPADAARYVDLGYAISDATTYRPTLLASLYRCTEIHLASDALGELLASGQLSSQDALRIMHRLAHIDLSSSLKDALEVERAMGIWVFDHLRDDPSSITASTGSSSLARTHGSGPLVHLWMDLDEGYYLTKMRQYIDCLSQPYRDLARTGKLADPSDMPKYAILSAVCLPLVQGQWRIRDEAQARINGSRIALALAIYHNQHKTYPVDLNKVSRLLGGKIPIDPFSGKAFVYKKQNPGCLLYSIGPDLKDNGGKEPPPGWGVALGGDIVWRLK